MLSKKLYQKTINNLNSDEFLQEVDLLRFAKVQKIELR